MRGSTVTCRRYSCFSHIQGSIPQGRSSLVQQKHILWLTLKKAPCGRSRTSDRQYCVHCLWYYEQHRS